MYKRIVEISDGNNLEWNGIAKFVESTVHSKDMKDKNKGAKIVIAMHM